MQPLTVDFICSLDGFGAAEGWPGWWGMESPEYLRWLDESPEKDHRTLGSVTLCRSLLNAGLVDRYRVVVFPVITGATGQDRIFDGYPDVRLELVQSRTFEGGSQLLEYVPTVLDGPPLGRP